MGVGKNMSWDKEYKDLGKLWGERPSELAIVAVKYLQKNGLDDTVLSILDIGCGYGRDAFYLLDNLRCSILGIDISRKAVEIAASEAYKTQKEDVKFQCADFTELKGEYDILFISNLYQLLKKDKRRKLRRTMKKMLKPKGLLFLSTLSVRDPEHFGRGIPISGEPNSFQDKTYLHFCTRDELNTDFNFLDIKELYEHEYYEPRANGEVHHHISWFLVGQ